MRSANHYDCTVSVETAFIAEQSDIAQNRYAFSYHITITNTGNVPAQLISRHWVIVEAGAVTQEVRGLGVVGEQPLIQPHEQYAYSSGTVLGSPSGEMHGTYQMAAEDGTRFEVEIPVFVLSMPRVLH